MLKKAIAFWNVQPHIMELIRGYSEECIEITVDQSRGLLTLIDETWIDTANHIAHTYQLLEDGKHFEPGWYLFVEKESPNNHISTALGFQINEIRWATEHARAKEWMLAMMGITRIARELIKLTKDIAVKIAQEGGYYGSPTPLKEA